MKKTITINVENLSEVAVEKIKVITELKKFAEENNDKVDWKNYKQKKYYLHYGFDRKVVFVEQDVFPVFNQIYFSSREIANKAIETIGEERLKKYYFDYEE
jgi:hypothetical protein